MTNIVTISTLFHSLGYSGTFTETDREVKASFNVGSELADVTFDKDSDYSQQAVLVKISREKDKFDPHNAPVGPIAGDPRKDELRAKSVAQPGAEIPEDGGPAIETPAVEKAPPPQPEAAKLDAEKKPAEKVPVPASAKVDPPAEDEDHK